jgi:hypothetical protein
MPDAASIVMDRPGALQQYNVLIRRYANAKQEAEKYFDEHKRQYQ